MKSLLVSIVAVALLVGCGESQQSSTTPESKPEPPTAVKVPDISIHDAAKAGNVEAVKQHLTSGTNVNAKDDLNQTPLLFAASRGYREIVELLIDNGAKVNTPVITGKTPLDLAADLETADLLRKHGGKTGEELKAEGK